MHNPDLANMIDMDAIRAVKIGMGVDPLGDAGVRYRGPSAERCGFEPRGRGRARRADLQVYERVEAPVPELRKGRASSALHQQRASEAKEARRNAENPCRCIRKSGPRQM
jgi:phosphoglucomutase